MGGGGVESSCETRMGLSSVLQVAVLINLDLRSLRKFFRNNFNLFPEKKIDKSDLKRISTGMYDSSYVLVLCYVLCTVAISHAVLHHMLTLQDYTPARMAAFCIFII